MGLEESSGLLGASRVSAYTERYGPLSNSTQDQSSGLRDARRVKKESDTCCTHCYRDLSSDSLELRNNSSPSTQYVQLSLSKKAKHDSNRIS